MCVCPYVSSLALLLSSRARAIMWADSATKSMPVILADWAAKDWLFLLVFICLWQQELNNCHYNLYCVCARLCLGDWIVPTASQAHRAAVTPARTHYIDCEWRAVCVCEYVCVGICVWLYLGRWIVPTASQARRAAVTPARTRYTAACSRCSSRRAAGWWCWGRAAPARRRQASRARWGASSARRTRCRFARTSTWRATAASSPPSPNCDLPPRRTVRWTTDTCDYKKKQK